MNFYDREIEIEKLRHIACQSLQNPQMTVVTGRRRIGKTQLLVRAYEQDTALYFFVARKSESLLCQDFIREIKEKLNLPILGEVQKFATLFEFLMQWSQKNPFTLIIDEFQEFFKINPSVYSEMQRIWDIYKAESRINLILCGSVYSLMHKIFQDYKEPLFGRATSFLKVKPFSTNVLKEILKDYNPQYTPEDLLALYTLTGGVAKYVQLLMDNDAADFGRMIDNLVNEDSVFVSEGRNVLVGEFGKDYASYFSILASISQGKNTRAEMESLLNREIGGYLTKLENDYNLIRKVQPIFLKSRTKNIRYSLDDNFLSFWFRFFYKYVYMTEINAFEKLKEIILRDYTVFSGNMLERYFRTVLSESGKFTQIGSYWDRKGENEIDIVAVNELEKTVVFVEVKRNAEKIQLNRLKEKAAHVLSSTAALNGFSVKYKGLSMSDM